MASVPRPHSPDPLVRRRFQQSLFAWYRRHRRDLPWRRTRDPYHILVSEIMLQQTQVERVVPKYHQFLACYPTLEALAHARPAAVRKLWYPLGYNVRPRRLHAIACEAVARYGGSLPDDGELLERLPGVGRYTVGALLSFAFGRDAPVVDTNVRRVLGRIFLGFRRLRRLGNDEPLWALAAAVLPPGRAWEWNQALMDFGATWCTSRAPRCPRCPMRTFCVSYPGRPAAPAGSPMRAGPRPSRRGPRPGGTR
jgi:A/G-specific adenine glycosylase